MIQRNLKIVVLYETVTTYLENDPDRSEYSTTWYFGINGCVLNDSENFWNYESRLGIMRGVETRE